ncbi:hypothetical protein KC331_g34 [Hortaea werneckii]|nr:hypothetical protein KC331_g34 [Hortaea werneckii]
MQGGQLCAVCRDINSPIRAFTSNPTLPMGRQATSIPPYTTYCRLHEQLSTSPALHIELAIPAPHTQCRTFQKRLDLVPPTGLPSLPRRCAVSYRCLPCAQCHALQQHIRDLPSHSTAFDCKDCDRVFKTEGALQQHIRDSSTHSATFDCTECRRNFKTEEALQQHTRDSPAHPTVFNCSECSRVFRTEEALQQHIRDSPVHPTRFDCNECSRVFRTQGALQQHVRDSPSHADDENSERGTQSFDMRPSLHCEVNELLQQYGLSFTFSPIDDSHEFLNEHDTSIMGKFNCTKTSCAKLRWTSKQIAITIRQLSGFRYNARIYHQQCELCLPSGLALRCKSRLSPVTAGDRIRAPCTARVCERSI